MTQKARKLSKAARVPLYGVLACALAYGMPTHAEGNAAAMPYASQAGQRAGTVLVTVVDQNNEPVVGASVVVMSTKAGAATDVNGRCSVDAKPGDKLQVSYIGFDTQTLTVGNNNNVLVTLGENKAMLDEIVVVGYGTQKKANLTGAVSTVDLSKTMAGRPQQDVAKALQGAVPGLSVISNNGDINGKPTLRIRGVGTLSNDAKSNPLIVVDGVPMDDISFLNTQDIESVSVLKDAASTSIYGTRAAFGVILIQTKGAHPTERSTITYSNNFAWDQATFIPDYPDVPTHLAQTFLHIFKEQPWKVKPMPKNTRLSYLACISISCCPSQKSGNSKMGAKQAIVRCVHT